MPDAKATALAALTIFSGDELFYVVEDDDGTPVSRRVTVEDLITGLKDLGFLLAGDGSITDIVALTQAEYDALTPAATTWYVITDEGSAQENGLLALVSYEPASAQNKATTATSLTALDTTNLRATFTAPPSGSVLVRLSGRAAQSTGGANYYWGLVQGASQRGKIQFITDSTAGARLSAAIRVTELTPGASVSLDWAALVSSNTGTLFIDASGNTSGPAVMEVWAAP